MQEFIGIGPYDSSPDSAERGLRAYQPDKALTCPKRGQLQFEEDVQVPCIARELRANETDCIRLLDGSHQLLKARQHRHGAPGGFRTGTRLTFDGPD